MEVYIDPPSLNVYFLQLCPFFSSIHVVFGQQLMIKEFLLCAVILTPGMQLWRHLWWILDVLVKWQWRRSLWPNHNKWSLISFLYLNVTEFPSRRIIFCSLLPPHSLPLSSLWLLRLFLYIFFRNWISFGNTVICNLQGLSLQSVLVIMPFLRDLTPRSSSWTAWWLIFHAVVHFISDV